MLKCESTPSISTKNGELWVPPHEGVVRLRLMYDRNGRQFITFRKHMIGKKYITCLKRLVNGRWEGDCPACSVYAWAWKTYARVLCRGLMPIERHLCVIIDRSNAAAGPQVYSTGRSVHEMVVSAAREDQSILKDPAPCIRKERAKLQNYYRVWCRIGRFLWSPLHRFLVWMGWMEEEDTTPFSNTQGRDMDLLVERKFFGGSFDNGPDRSVPDYSVVFHPRSKLGTNQQVIAWKEAAPDLSVFVIRPTESEIIEAIREAYPNLDLFEALGGEVKKPALLTDGLED